VRLAGTPCSTTLMLGLADAIDRAGRGDSRVVIITPPAEPGSATSRWEFLIHLTGQPEQIAARLSARDGHAPPLQHIRALTAAYVDVLTDLAAHVPVITIDTTAA
jgi:hypothetical protein